MCSHGFVDPSITVGEEGGGRVGNVEDGEERSEEPNGDIALLPRCPAKRATGYVRVTWSEAADRVRRDGGVFADPALLHSH